MCCRCIVKFWSREIQAGISLVHLEGNEKFHINTTKINTSINMSSFVDCRLQSILLHFTLLTVIGNLYKSQVFSLCNIHLYLRKSIIYWKEF